MAVSAPKVRLPEARLAAAAVLDKPTVVIQAFSAVRAKQPSPSLFGDLIDALDGYDVVLTGAPSDLERYADYAVLLERDNVRFDSATFEQVIPLLRGADLVVSVDTALMHLAVLSGAKTLCLASAAYVGEIVPYADEVTPDGLSVLYESMPCEGCLGGCALELVDSMFPCVARLKSERVIKAAKDLLSQP